MAWHNAYRNPTRLLQEKVNKIMKEKQKKARKEGAREEVAAKRKSSKKNILDRFRKTSKT